MTTRADFTTEEWQVVRAGPPSAALIVAAAERGGSVRESLAFSRAYARERRDPAHGPLLAEIVASTPEIGRIHYGSVDELRDECAQNLRDAVAVLREQATTAEVDEYRRFILDLADRVAMTHRPGFLALGGPRDSDAERAALEEVARALDLGPTAVVSES